MKSIAIEIYILDRVGLANIVNIYFWSGWFMCATRGGICKCCWPLLVQPACALHLWWQTETYLAIVNTDFFMLSSFSSFFYVYCFSPTSRIPSEKKKIEICLNWLEFTNKFPFSRTWLATSVLHTLQDLLHIALGPAHLTHN